jgi:hypothetical protein
MIFVIIITTSILGITSSNVYFGIALHAHKMTNIFFPVTVLLGQTNFIDVVTHPVLSDRSSL